MSRSKSRLQSVVDEIEHRGATGHAVAGDLTNGDDCQRAVEEAVRNHLASMWFTSRACTAVLNTAQLGLHRISACWPLQADLMGGLDILINNGTSDYRWCSTECCINVLSVHLCMSLERLTNDTHVQPASMQQEFTCRSLLQ